MWKLPLTQGKFALIDEWNAEFLQQWNWTAVRDRNDRWYARRGTHLKIVHLHRVIAERAGLLNTTNLEIDHANLDGLDNRIENLRLATTAQNSANRRKRSDNTSGHKGVSWHKQSGKWRVSISYNGRRHYLGLFDLIEDAIRAYAEASEKYHAEYGRIK